MTLLSRFTLRILLVLSLLPIEAIGQQGHGMPDLTEKQTYTLRRATSSDPTGGNADARSVAPGETFTVLDENGPGMVSHIWFTIADQEPYHLKRIVLRIYWDGESTPSVEAPIGDFFGLGTGDYFNWQSELLSVGSSKALNCFFPMPYAKHARITVTNEGTKRIDALYYNIEYRVYPHPLPAHTLYFHAQYRQATPNHGWTANWYGNGDAIINDKKNLTGEDNYVWMEAQGDGQYVGVTMSVLQNQDDWWGEGDDMFFIDGAPTPSINGTGTPFSYQLYGAPVVGAGHAGSRSSMYRFHLDSPIPFSKSFKATMEHGHANHRSDNFYSVAYWYQTEPHMPFPALPPVDDRIPVLKPVGGPGNSGPDGRPTTPHR